MSVAKMDLEEMDDGQLEALRSKVERLQDRRLEEQVRRDAEERRSAEEAKGAGGGHVRWEMVRCNDCLRCKAGLKPHGPYLYRYFWREGRLRCEYLGKAIKAKHVEEAQLPEGTRPEDIDAAGVARAQADVARQWAAIQAEHEEADAGADTEADAGEAGDGQPVAG